MIQLLLSKLFPPRKGRIKEIDAVMRAIAIRNGEVEVYEGEESQPGRVFEWPQGRWAKPIRIR